MVWFRLNLETTTVYIYFRSIFDVIFYFTLVQLNLHTIDPIKNSLFESNKRQFRAFSLSLSHFQNIRPHFFLHVLNYFSFNKKIFFQFFRILNALFMFLLE